MTFTTSLRRITLARQSRGCSRRARRHLFETLEVRQVLSAAFDVVDLTAMRNDPAFSAIDGHVESGPIGVAVLDSGVVGSHADLQGNFVAWFDAVTDGGNAGAVNGPGSTNVNASIDPDGHGTHVAGTVGATDPEIGVATDVGLIGVRALPSANEPQPFHNTILAGLNWVLANHQRYNIRVVNMSIQNSTNNDSPIALNDWGRAIQRLEQVGVTVVSASGNGYGQFAAAGASAPAIFSSLSVANTWEDAGVGDQIPSYGGVTGLEWLSVDTAPQADQLAASSQRSTLPNQVAAPGSTIFSTWNGNGGNFYQTISGTSMASPLVAGMVALMQDAAFTFGGRYLTVPEVVNIVRTTADKIVDSQNPATQRILANDNTGFSLQDLPETGESFLRVNVHQAMRAVRDLVTTNVDNPAPPPDPDDRMEDTNNTLTSAVTLPMLDATNEVRMMGFIGTDGQVNVGQQDVDLFRLELESPGNLTVAINPVNGGQDFDPVVRLFDSQGSQIAILDDDSQSDVYPTLGTDRLSPGTYYVGVSSYNNISYNVVNGTGSANGQSAGNYELFATLGNPDPNGVVQGAVDIDLTVPNVFNPNQNLVNLGVPVAHLVPGVIDSDPNPIDPAGPRIQIGATDVDFFRIVAPDTGFLYVDINAADVLGPVGIDSYLRIFNGQGQEIAFHDDDLSGVFTDSFLEVPVNEGETYFIAVTTYGNRDFNPTDPFDRTSETNLTGQYELYASFYNGDVNGNAFGAVPVQEGPAGGTIGSDFNNPLTSAQTNGGFKDVDFFTYTAPQAGLLELDVSSADASLIASLGLWELSQAQDNVLQIGESEGATASLQYELQAGQTVFFSITGQGNGGFNWFSTASGTGGDTGDYQVQISRSGLNVVSQLANDSINQHTPTVIDGGGGVVSAKIGRDSNLIRTASDVDIYSFVPTSSSMVDITAGTRDEFGADTFLRVFDSQGQEIAFNDDASANTTNSALSLAVTAGQTYYIGVNGYSENARDYNPRTGSGAAPGSIGQYTLSVAPDDAPTGEVIGDYSGNGSVEQADLDLVLLNWGRPGTPAPSGWNQQLPTGNIDQNELDAVLLHWGETAPRESVSTEPAAQQALTADSLLGDIARAVVQDLADRDANVGFIDEDLVTSTPVSAPGIGSTFADPSALIGPVRSISASAKMSPPNVDDTLLPELSDDTTALVDAVFSPLARKSATFVR